MKRLSEIVGATPMFVRWAIGQTCEMRDELDGSDPFAVEKQLHAIKTAASAIHENRVIDGIAMHPTAAEPETSVSNALGFPVEESFVAYGGMERVGKACHQCQACIPTNGESIPANCYGWLILDLDDGKLSKKLADVSNSFDWHNINLKDTKPKWHAMWLQRYPLPDQLSNIEKFVQKLNEATCDSYQDWVIFAAAIARCRKHNLKLFMDLVPAGFSDGVYWSIGPYCPECMHAQDETDNNCFVCGRFGKPHPIKKRRSKGLRPYLRLMQLVGSKTTGELLNKYRSSR